ncbi:1209_t:CDS:2, partial [Racocetra fulgida]
IFIPSLRDGTRLEARVGVNYVDDQKPVKAIIIAHPYGPLGRTSWSGEPECEDYKTMLEFLSKSGRIGENTILQIPNISDVTIIQWVKDNKAVENLLWTIKELKGTDHFYTYHNMEDKLIKALDEWINN